MGSYSLKICLRQMLGCLTSNYAPAQDLSESDSDYSPKKKKIKKEKKSRDTKVVKKKEKVKSKKKTSKNDEYEADYQKQLDLALSNSNLQPSEEFIIFILKQVDELCENIKNGDPDIE